MSLQSALAAITEMGNRPSMRGKIAADPRSIFLRAKAHQNDLDLTGAGAMNAGRMVFADFCSPRYYRNARINRLIQVRSWQIAGIAKADRKKLLSEAAQVRCREVLARGIPDFTQLDAAIAAVAEPLLAEAM